MKNKLTFLIVVFATIFLTTSAISQENANNNSSEFEPVYITVTTLHGVGGVDINEWKAIEQEYFDNVTSKIDLLISHEVLISNILNDFSDIKVVNVFKSWDDIEKINDLREDLIEQAWPDENIRKQFFEKQNSFYTNYHSDEIYISTRFGYGVPDEIKKTQKKSFVYFVQTSTLADDNANDSYEFYKKYVDNVFRKNSLIKGYYAQRHLWGSDSRDFVEIFAVNSTEDIKKIIEKNRDLLKEFVPNEEKRKEFLDAYNEGIERRSNAIYVNVPSLSK